MSIRDRPLLIVGASTRAAAQSALRAGRRPLCADAFADEDLRRIATVYLLADYPCGVLRALRDVPPMPWCYTGGLENRPRLLSALARQRPLIGNGADVVRAVRDPFRLAAALAEARLPALAVRSAGDPPPTDGTWLRKPLRSGGGIGVALWSDAVAAQVRRRDGHWFQRRAEGASVSMTFVAGESVRAVGACRHFERRRGLCAGPFGWCGAVGPVELPSIVDHGMRQVGTFLAERFGLRGLFGVDFVTDGQTAWPLEVNPRYTATVELLEAARGRSLLAKHLAVFGEAASAWSDAERHAGRVAAKAIVYAPRALNVPPWHGLDDALFPQPADPRALPALADVPRSGTEIPAGSPVCTVLAAAPDVPGASKLLRERLRSLSAHFGLAAAVTWTFDVWASE